MTPERASMPPIQHERPLPSINGATFNLDDNRIEDDLLDYQRSIVIDVVVESPPRFGKAPERRCARRLARSNSNGSVRSIRVRSTNKLKAFQPVAVLRLINSNRSENAAN